MRLRGVRAAVADHPRHILLFAAATGLLLAPLSPAATLAAAAAAAATVFAARAAAPGPRPPAARPLSETTPADPGVASPIAAAAARSSPQADAVVESPRVAAPPPLESSPAAAVVESPRIAARPPRESSPAAAVVAASRLSSRPPGATLLPAIAVAAAVLVGALLADLRIAALDGGPLPRMHGRVIAARAVLLEPIRERAVGPTVARARIGDGPARGEVAVLRVRAEAYAGPWPGVGEVVAVEGEVAPLGGFDAYQRRRGADAALEVARMRPTGERRGGLAGVVDSARRRAEHGLARGLSDEEAALVRGMVLGQDERLDERVRNDFERSGLAHVLAVSGQNVMLLATLVLTAGAAFGIGLRARLVLALTLVALYVPLTGAGPSIQRAGVMGAAGLVAALAGRPTHRWYALGLAALVTLALNPRTAGEPGWQLSFAAVAALLALAPPLRAALVRRLPGPVADIAAITVAATAGTAPLMAFHFQQVSLAALPANLLAAAAIAPVMWLGMLAGAAAQLAPALAVPFNAANAPLLAFVQWVAHTMAAAPGAVMPLRLRSPVELLAAYAALAATIATARAAWRRTARAWPRGGEPAAWSSAGGEPPGVLGWSAADRDPSAVVASRAVGPGSPTVVASRAVAPGSSAVVASRAVVPGSPAGFASWLDWAAEPPAPRWRAIRRRVVAVVVAVPVLVLLLATAISVDTVAPPARGELVVSFLDVGQGDATLLQKDGVAVLVDTGPPGGPILRRLAEAGVERLDALVITHAQSDHEGAALTVLRRVPARLIVNGGDGWPTAVQDGLAEAARGARRMAAHAGQVLTLGGIRMRLLWPPPPGPDFRPDGDPNDRALVAHVEVGDFDLLLPADAESNVTATLPLPDVEALKVAHHGSADEGLPAMLERTDPELAAIEVGRGNTYGHPAPSTLSALRVVRRVYRTDRDGTIRLRVRRGEMTIEH